MTASARVTLSLGVFLVALVTLMVELLLIRVFDVVLVSNLGYMIISCALFAFGLAGVYAALRPLKDLSRVDIYLAALSVALAVSCILQLPLLNANPFDLRLATERPVAEVFYFSLMYLTVSLPFFFAGLILATAFSVYATQIRKLYFFDLVGAAIGAVIVVPLIRPFGPGGLMFMTTGLALIAAAMFRGRTLPTVLAVGTAVALSAVPLLRGDGYYDFRLHLDKRGVMEAFDAGEVEVTVWDPVSKIDVIPVLEPRGRVPEKHVSYDGGSQSSNMFLFDGDFAALRAELEEGNGVELRHFWNRGVPVAHWFKADSGAEVLIIGSAAGQETKAALTYGAAHVDAIEMVGAVVDLVTGPYASYIGNLFSDPRVEVAVGEGRTFLRSTDKTYDIIQIFSNHTSSSAAAGNGAAAPTYLQTADAYVEYFTSLKDDGILSINHHVYPRMITAAALAWQWLGRSNFRDHVLVYSLETEDTLPTMLIKMSPWTADEVARINAYMLAPNPGEPYVLMENPVAHETGFLSDTFFDQPESPELSDMVDYAIRPPTDDRPYFNFLRRIFAVLEPSAERYLTQDTAFRLNSQIRTGVPQDLVHFFVTGAAALLFALVFVFVPLLASPAGRSHWPNKLTSIFYFSCLGAGFIIIELTLIHIFMKLIGFPLYAYSVVIFTMLLAAGLGSLAADRLDISPTRHWAVPFIGLLVLGAIVWLAHPVVFGFFLAAPIAVRILIGAAMILPMGFFMGMPLPLGILALADQPRGAVAWAWAMNGLFTVIGGLIAAIGSIYLGFSAMLLIGFAIYVAAAIAFLRLHRTQAAVDQLASAGDPLSSVKPA